MGLPDETLGQIIKAFVVCRVGKTASFEELVTFCNEELRGIWRRSLLKYCQNCLNPPVVK